MPEALEGPLSELAEAYDEVGKSEGFHEKLRGHLEEFAGQSTPLYHARNLSDRYGAEIYLRREDLLHGSAHKINNSHESVALVGQPEPSVLVTRSDRRCSRRRRERTG